MRELMLFAYRWSDRPIRTQFSVRPVEEPESDHHSPHTGRERPGAQRLINEREHGRSDQFRGTKNPTQARTRMPVSSGVLWLVATLTLRLWRPGGARMAMITTVLASASASAIHGLMATVIVVLWARTCLALRFCRACPTAGPVMQS